MPPMQRWEWPKKRLVQCYITHQHPPQVITISVSMIGCLACSASHLPGLCVGLSNEHTKTFQLLCRPFSEVER